MSSFNLRLQNGCFLNTLQPHKTKKLLPSSGTWMKPFVEKEGTLQGCSEIWLLAFVIDRKIILLFGQVVSLFLLFLVCKKLRCTC